MLDGDCRRLGGAHLGSRGGFGDLGERQDRQDPFGGAGRLHFPLEGSEAAHFHLDGPRAVGEIVKYIGALKIGKRGDGLVALARGYGSPGHGQGAKLDHTSMLPGGKHAGSHQHENQTTDLSVPQ